MAEVAGTSEWSGGRLLVTGPADSVAAFGEAARGSGITPWHIDYGRLEEDAFHLALRVPSARRSLSIEGCRILARQYRDKVQAHHARAAALVGRSRGCPFDLHALVPVPEPILQLGQGHPEAAAWLTANWGVAELRKVARLDDPAIGKRLPAAHAKAGYAFWALGGRGPDVAAARLLHGWPELRFKLKL